jgi:hypothetical protein
VVGCTNKPNSCPYADPEIGVPGKAIMSNKVKLGQAEVSGGRRTGVPVAQDKANLPGGVGRGETWGTRSVGVLYKQTQFRQSARGAGGEMCQTNPIQRDLPCETKPIPGRCGRREPPSFQYSSPIASRTRHAPDLRSRLTNPGALTTIRVFHGFGVHGISPAVYGEVGVAQGRRRL